MAKYIAHASIDERGKIAGGAAGDSTKKEVCIRTWYSKAWKYVLRIKNEKVRIAFANNMIDIAKNDKIGYDQNQRNTLLTQAKKVNFDFSKISVKCECDCSSAVTIAYLAAVWKALGEAQYNKAYKILVVNGNCATTSTLRSRLNKLEAITIYSSRTYVAGTSKAVFGDIYIKEGSHVVAFINDGKKVTGKENKVLEFQKAAIKDGFEFPKYGPDGEWGGECEDVAKAALIKKRTEDGKAVYKYPNLTMIVQRAVGVDDDGKCGNDTAEAIGAYQRKHGLIDDECCGLKTWKVILGV